MNETSTASNVKSIFYSTGIIWYTLAVIETLLVFRFMLKITAANADTWFTSTIYGLSYPLILPFTAIFGANTISTATVEKTTLLAMIVFWILAAGFSQLVIMNKPVSLREANISLMKQRIL